MSKTAREVIAEHLNEVSEHPRGDSLAASKANDIVKALDADGFVIVPKEPTEKILDELYDLSDETSGSDEPARELYRAMIAAATETS